MGCLFFFQDLNLPWHRSVIFSDLRISDLTEDLHGKFSISYVFVPIFVL